MRAEFSQLIKKVVLMQPILHPMLNIAVKAARRAGNLIYRMSLQEYWHRRK